LNGTVLQLSAAQPKVIVATGADANHFANLRVLLGSWIANMRGFPLAVCDYSLSEGQKMEMARLDGLEILPAPTPVTHPWQGKSLLGRFFAESKVPWDIVMWIDADALFARALPEVPPLISGYDMILDAHVRSVGEIASDENRRVLGLRADDAYFAAGWWVARRGCLLENYERLTALVQGRGNLWEGDAFVAAIYLERLKIRTVCGSVWHSRGLTSLHSCTVDGLVPRHAGQAIYVIHANDGYSTRHDGRRVFKRPELAAIQDYYEAEYLRAVSGARHSPGSV
jgi:hypothetical protein